MITEHEKRRHPQYQEYIENFEAVLTGLEAGMRGIGAPDLIAEKCLEAALSFYDADSAALVESNRELSYGVCVTELCKPGVKSYQGRIINITAEDTPYLYNKIMSNEGFDLSYPEDKEELSFYESMLMEKMRI